MKRKVKLLLSIFAITLFISCNLTGKDTNDNEVKKDMEKHVMEDGKMMDKDAEMKKDMEKHTMEDDKMMDKDAEMKKDMEKHTMEDGKMMDKDAEMKKDMEKHTMEDDKMMDKDAEMKKDMEKHTMEDGKMMDKDAEMKKDMEKHTMEDGKMMDKDAEMKKDMEKHTMEDGKMMDKDADWPIATLLGKGNYGVEGVANLKKSEKKLKIMDFKYKGNAPDGYVALGRIENDKFTPLYYISEKLEKIDEPEKMYTIPDDVDLNKVNAVAIWCKKYSVDMGSGIFK